MLRTMHADQPLLRPGSRSRGGSSCRLDRTRQRAMCTRGGPERAVGGASIQLRCDYAFMARLDHPGECRRLRAVPVDTVISVHARERRLQRSRRPTPARRPGDRLRDSDSLRVHRCNSRVCRRRLRSTSTRARGHHAALTIRKPRLPLRDCFVRGLRRAVAVRWAKPSTTKSRRTASVGDATRLPSPAPEPRRK
jgi:hypothetical protein